MANELQKQTFSGFLTSPLVKAKINEVIGGVNGQRFMTQILSAVTNNPLLQNCEPMTLLNCAFLGESLKLSPSPQLGQYYMVPFKDTKNDRTVSTFQLGYKGYIQLAIRSGQYKKLNVLAIKQGELVNFDPLNEIIDVNLIQDEEVREKTKTIGYYAMFEYVNGFRKAMYWSRSKMEVHAERYSKGYNAKKGYTFWEKDFDGMAYKTMLRQLISKWGIMSIDMQTAFESDMTVEDEKGKIYYPDNDNDNYVNQISAPPKSVPEDAKQKLDSLKNPEKKELSPYDKLRSKLTAEKINMPEFLAANGLTVEDTEQFSNILNDSEYYKTCVSNMKPTIPAKNHNQLLALLVEKLKPHNVTLSEFEDATAIDTTDELMLKKLVEDEKFFKQTLKTIYEGE